MDRKQVASVLGEVADLLELKGENTFKVRAYANAARAVSSLEEDLAGLVESGELVKVKGIGKGLAENITELVRTENLEMLDELKAGFPPGLFELLKIQGLGPKKVKVLYEDLGVESLGELEYACRENRLITLKGFGPKSQANILKGIENLKKYRGRHLWAEVESDALDLLEKLRACPHLSRVEPAGSYRRLKEVVKDLDFVAAGDDPDAVVSYLESPGHGRIRNRRSRNKVQLQAGIGNRRGSAHRIRQCVSVCLAPFYRQQGTQHPDAWPGQIPWPQNERIRTVRRRREHGFRR